MDYLQQLFSRFFGTGDSDADYANYCSTPKKVIGFGNALLDYSREIDDKSIFDRYQFEEGSVGLLDSEKLHTLADELCAESSCVINPGGSVLNTVRILKRLGTDATFFGAIGADEHGKQITEILKEKCIDARLETIPDQPTGMCICMITKDKRTLYANIGAASKFSLDFLKSKICGRNNDQNDGSTCLRPVERKQIIYIEGFFVPEHDELCEYIVKYLIHDRRRLAFNLSAPYVIQQNFAQVLHLCQHAFFIFSNADEFAVLTEYMGCKSMEDAARTLLQHGTVAKIIVITDGAKSIQLVTNFVDESSPPGEILFQNFNVPRADNVVDTTGAGDSFVAGFLHAWLEKRQVSECIRYACDIAIQVLTQIGCNLPEEST